MRKFIKILSGILFIAFIIGVFGLKIYLNQEKKHINHSKVEEIITDVNEDIKEEVNKNVFVDIKGAVINPGVYEIDQNKKVIDVVSLAGGLKENADTSLVNLAKKVANEMVVIIYTKEEVAKAQEPNQIIKYVDKKCICPEIKNDACINNSIKKENSSSSNNKDTSDSKNNNEDVMVNLNTATLEELQTLSGIGESKAEAIIQYREEHGGFMSIEELKEVSGIGASLYEKVKDHITV